MYEQQHTNNSYVSEDRHSQTIVEEIVYPTVCAKSMPCAAYAYHLQIFILSWWFGNSQ